MAFDTDPRQVAQGRADGFPVMYGDISDPALLSSIHVERSSLVVMTVDSLAPALRVIAYLRRTCPQVPVVARARDLESSTRLLEAGALHAYPEAIEASEASLRLGATALKMLQVPAADVDQLLQGVRDRGYKPVLEDDQGK